MRLAERLGALVTAIGAARERQETSANVVRERAELIQQRSEALTAPMRWEALGIGAPPFPGCRNGSRKKWGADCAPWCALRR